MKIFLFESVHGVMAAEKTLRDSGIRYELLPTPKEYSRDCGMCLGIDPSMENEARRILGRAVCSVVDSPDQGGR